jgi:hypothetical protein
MGKWKELAEIHTCTPDFSKAGFGKPQREEGCAGCGKKASKGWALYCVKCTEREWVGLTDEEKEHYRKLGLVGVEIIETILKEKNYDKS